MEPPAAVAAVGAPYRLMTPGPTHVAERVLRAGCRVLHHRSPEFSDALDELLRRLRPLFGLSGPDADGGDVLPVHGTGRAAMEAALVNLLAPGDTVLACCNGKFGDMWTWIAGAYGLRIERVGGGWGSSLDPSEVRGALERLGGAAAVTLVHSESSTGALNPVAAIAEVAREYGALVLVDAISSVGGAPFRFDEWGVDVAVTASQKCLMSSPGISFVALGPRAWSAAARPGLPVRYLSFEAIRETLAGPSPQTPGTTPVSLILQVLEATRMIHEEGVESVYDRHEDMATTVRVRAGELGCELYGDGITVRSPTLTALELPAGVPPTALRAALRERGVLIAGGLGETAASCVRIGHMGDARPDDIARLLELFEAALAEAR